MTEHPGSLLDQLLRERFPTHAEGRREETMPVPPADFLPHLPPVDALGGTCARTLTAARRNDAIGMSA